MNATTQHISPNPALDFANSILEETNGGLELIEILHDIAQGIDEDATTNDRIAAAKAKPKVRYVDPKALAEARAEIQRMKDEGILTPNPNTPKRDYSIYLKGTDEEVAPYAKEGAAKFWAAVDLRLERQKQWPEIEERRRKKLTQIYPSHSDGGLPDT